jgi:hypothetical protein
MNDMLSEKAILIIPKWFQKMPFVNDWVEYKGEVFFAMINFERTKLSKKPMIDLCYCATTGLINNRVLKTVQYDKSKFKLHKFNL